MEPTLKDGQLIFCSAALKGRIEKGDIITAISSPKANVPKKYLIEDGKLKKADNAVLYTYLPTSYSFGEGFPFLVNANFITDEGRQHLDVDAEWNKVLISKIPEGHGNEIVP